MDLFFQEKRVLVTVIYFQMMLLLRFSNNSENNVFSKEIKKALQRGRLKIKALV